MATDDSAEEIVRGGVDFHTECVCPECGYPEAEHHHTSRNGLATIGFLCPDCGRIDRTDY